MSTEPLFAPFAGWLIRPDWAARVIAGAYDAKSPEERRSIVAANPYSYLGVTRSSEDLAADDDADEDELLRRGAATLSTIIEADAFGATTRPALYAYRLTYAGHSQTGVVGTVHVSGFEDGRILTHENVRPDRAQLLGRHLEWVGGTSSPVALTHRADPAVQVILDRAAEAEPDVSHVVEEVLHQVWTLSESESAAVCELLADETVYVTDGHHRSAAALAGAANNPDNPVFQRTLAVLFPDNDLRVEAFHRRCHDSQGRTPDEIAAALADLGPITEVATLEEARPQAKGEIGVYNQGRWWRMQLHPTDATTALGQLDVERVRCEIFRDLLGVDELVPNSGADYIPAPTGMDEVVRRCDEDGRIGFIMYATSVEDLMAVADDRALMPPKSSYVAPKPRSGIFLRILSSGATAHLDPS